MIHTTPPDRSAWHQVPPGEIHYGTFTDVYGFEFRPGWAFRCGDCLQVGVGYSHPRDARAGALRHRDEDHAASVLTQRPYTARSLDVALASPADFPALARG